MTGTNLSIRSSPAQERGGRGIQRPPDVHVGTWGDGRLEVLIQQLWPTGYSRPVLTRPRGCTSAAPRVSVVVPCYNYGRYLEACVDSVLGQPGVDVDVLIIDDASPDGSGLMAESVAAQRPRVRVLHNPVNRGHIATYNIGFSHVDGDYVLLLSADDMLTPGALSRAVRLMEEFPSVGFVYGWSLDVIDDVLPVARTKTLTWSVWDGKDWLEDNCRRATNVIRSSDAVFRRSLLDRVGGYREDLPHSGDHEWWLRAAQVADVGRLGGVDQLYYRLHGSNMSRTQYASALANLHETRKAFDAALSADVGSDEENLERLRQIAYRALARKALWLAVWEYMSSPDGVDNSPAYREFALSVFPGVAETRWWRALTRREAVGRDRARKMLAFRARERVRDLEGRFAWHRNRIVGV
ncbi:glycosyltransferase family 2 protein [Geodermatophilus normandii]|nr:glycosyltransferase family 2 protein [Geodermatophilus normandii]